jgi:hypothetical protein
VRQWQERQGSAQSWRKRWRQRPWDIASTDRRDRTRLEERYYLRKIDIML